MAESNTRILVLGIGNILLKDEGAGIYAIETLIQNYQFTSNVTLIEGGTLGIKLLSFIENTDHLIVLDAVQLEGVPGSIHILTGDDLEPSLAGKKSLHQVSFMETLLYADMLGNLPRKTIILGIVPKDMNPWGIGLTEPLTNNFPDFIETALEVIVRAGSDYEKNHDFVSLNSIIQSKVELYDCPQDRKPFS